MYTHTHIYIYIYIYIYLYIYKCVYNPASWSPSYTIHGLFCRIHNLHFHGFLCILSFLCSTFSRSLLYVSSVSFVVRALQQYVYNAATCIRQSCDAVGTCSGICRIQFYDILKETYKYHTKETYKHQSCDAVVTRTDICHIPYDTSYGVCVLW